MTYDSFAELLRCYFDSFSRKDLDSIAAIMAENIELQDPVVGLVRGREAVLQINRDIFASAKNLSITIKRIFGQDGVYGAEFSLLLESEKGDVSTLEGVDIIEVENAKIRRLRAYFDVGSTTLKKEVV